ncbi:hypothetical protein SISSUDRAFT_1054079 [Sistotremastrum suecicum HHB10207 ss-3]|uniref:Uncharacterized protein n=1 Tax=Sistotremastrum suecicum HHB10207 ss-3 TaxID=1314776 RepID=A0A165YRS5_9AGAM|nr:hypothetical protein SISSUDRAFT_1054079 [Sistotremastrum suecicum HHB10207 ss-3]
MDGKHCTGPFMTAFVPPGTQYPLPNLTQAADNSTASHMEVLNWSTLLSMGLFTTGLLSHLQYKASSFDENSRALRMSLGGVLLDG